MCDVHTYENDDQILQDLLETNIRQRGDVGGSAKKVGKRIKELERIYGIEHGNNQRTSNNFKSCKTQEQLAKDMDITVQTLQNYKLLAEMIPELDELVDTGIVTKTTALAMMKNLSPDEQEQLITSLDTTKKLICCIVYQTPKSKSISPNGETLSFPEKIHTDKELAKLAGVGTGTIARFNRVMSSDDEVMEWMLDIQLGRRNLSPIQRIAVAEKYRPIYERQALFNKRIAMQEARKNNDNNKSEQFSQNSSETVCESIDVRNKLANIAGVSTDTYSKGKKF